MRTGTMGSAAVDQFGSASKFHILNIPEEVLGKEAWANYLKVPGRAVDTMPAGTYKNQANNDVDVLASAFVMFVGVSKNMNE